MDGQLKQDSSNTVTEYTPDSSLANPREMIGAMCSDLIMSQGLAWQLALRDIKAQYRQAFLGFLWAFIIPLAHTLTWIFLNSSGIVSVKDTALPYPVYVLTGTVLWSVLMDSINAPLQQTTSNRSMLAKLKFPREALLLSGIYQTLFNTGIRVLLLLVALLVLGINPGVGIVFFPIGLLSLILVGTAIGLMLTPIGLLYTDVGRAVPLLMQFVMYFSPVVFPMPEDGIAASILKINPFTPLILTARDWLTGIAPEYLVGFMIVNAIALVVLVVGWVAYRLAMPIIIERMSA
jgi:homopolymeric O-antigen transport system permease protein